MVGICCSPGSHFAGHAAAEHCLLMQAHCWQAAVGSQQGTNQDPQSSCRQASASEARRAQQFLHRHNSTRPGGAADCRDDADTMRVCGAPRTQYRYVIWLGGLVKQLVESAVEWHTTIVATSEALGRNQLAAVSSSVLTRLAKAALLQEDC